MRIPRRAGRRVEPYIAPSERDAGDSLVFLVWRRHVLSDVRDADPYTLRAHRLESATPIVEARIGEEPIRAAVRGPRDAYAPLVVGRGRSACRLVWDGAALAFEAAR
ncbi:MAG: hypothetical protein AB7S26_42500 [Sandaracinaceae bacterium]